MADQREVILARLAVLCAAVPGVAAVVRNSLDVAGLARPAVVIHDGTEELRDQPSQIRHSEIQRMVLSPGITVYVRAGGPADAGVLMSRYRSAIVAAVLTDAPLDAAIGTNGTVRYEGCIVSPPDAEAKEHRVDITLTFQYVFKLDELVAP